MIYDVYFNSLSAGCRVLFVLTSGMSRESIWIIIIGFFFNIESFRGRKKKKQRLVTFSVIDSCSRSVEILICGMSQTLNSPLQAQQQHNLILT